MSTFTGSKSSQQIHSSKDLAGYFQRFCKPISDFRIGLEAEFFGVDCPTGLAIGYAGESGIENILKEMARLFGYQPIYDQDHVIALKKGELMVTLEPGGQLELSAPPVKTTQELEGQITEFFKQLHGLRERFPKVRWLAFGIQPFSGIYETAWVPKKRYELMWDYFETKGSLSREMMRLTATNQVSFDYSSEEHAMKMMRVTLLVSSIASAIFANSSFSDGQPNGFRSRRLHIWNHNDPDRSGLIRNLMLPNKKFSDYLDYILNIPIFFIVRNDQWIHPKGITFKHFIERGYEGFSPTMDDFELHLSTIFPEARLKQYLEVRCIDGQLPKLIPAMAAFWKGLLYSNKAIEETQGLLEKFSIEEHLKLHEDVPKSGMDAVLGKYKVLDLAKEVVRFSRLGLKESSNLDSEIGHLDQISEEILVPKESPGEKLLRLWNTEFGFDRQKLLDYLVIDRGFCCGA